MKNEVNNDVQGNNIIDNCYHTTNDYVYEQVKACGNSESDLQNNEINDENERENEVEASESTFDDEDVETEENIIKTSFENLSNKILAQLGFQGIF